MTRDEMGIWVVAALKALGGKGHYVEVAKWIWSHHEADLRAAGDYFYKWQYEMRWAGDGLVKKGLIEKGTAERGVWSLLKGSR